MYKFINYIFEYFVPIQSWDSSFCWMSQKDKTKKDGPLALGNLVSQSTGVEITM